jgi:hypothetical protein
MEQLYAPTLAFSGSRLSEEEFQEYQSTGRYEELAILLIEETLALLNASSVNSYLRQQAIEACTEVLRQHRNANFESFLRGVRSAVRIILLSSDHIEPPHRLQIAN